MIYKKNPIKSLAGLIGLMTWGLFSTANADIDYVFIYKEKVFQQFDNTPPVTPSIWFFNAGASGNSQLTGGTVVYPGSGGPVTLTGSAGNYTTDGGDYLTQAAMDAVFPNGDVSLTIIDNGVTRNFEPFSITGDDYPNTPFFFNLEDLNNHDGALDFDIEWTPFVGAGPDDRIIFQIFEPELEQEVIFEVLPGTATNFRIPGGTFQENFGYDMEIFFLKSKGVQVDPEGLIGYISSVYTNVSVSSFGNSINIPDDAVREAVKLELDLQPEDPIALADIQTLTTLTVTSSSFVDLTGLEYASSLAQLTINTDWLLNTFPVTNISTLNEIKVVAPQKEGLFFTHWSDGSQETPRIIQNTGSQNVELVANYSSTPLSPFAGGYRLTKSGTVLAVTDLPPGLDVEAGDPYEVRFDYVIREETIIEAVDGSLAALDYNSAGLLPIIGMEAEVRIGNYRWILRSSNEAAVKASVISAIAEDLQERVQFGVNTLNTQTKSEFPFSRGRESISISVYADRSKGSLFNGPLKVPDDPNYLNLDAITLLIASVGSGDSTGGTNWEINLNKIIGPNDTFKFERLPSYLDLERSIVGYATDRPNANVERSTDSLQIFWNDPYSQKFETTYEVWRGTNNIQSSAKMVASDLSDTFFTDFGVSPGRLYYYWIRAIRDGLKADFSLPVSNFRAVAYPEDIQATQGDFTDRIRVSWTRVSGATSYTLYRSTSEDFDNAEILEEGITGTEYEDFSPETDDLYYYWVTSSAFGISSDFSNVAKGYRVADGITTVRASDGLYNDRVRINWDPFPGSTSYTLYRNSVNDSSSAVILANDIAATQYDDLPGPENQGVTFFYWVRPIMGGETGSFSNSDTGYIPVQRITTVLAWGDNDFDQTNIPDTNLLDIIEIAAGANHSLALASDGTVVGWGRNEFDQSTPPGGLTDIVDIAVGYDHSLALKRDGTVVAWGRNTFGKATVPVDLTNVIDIEAGAEHSLALLADGSVAAWGGNDAGQTDIPETLTQVVQISAGGYHNIARQADGSVTTWGDNSLGQQDIPAGIVRVIDISAGWNHSLVILPNGTVDGWGDNSRGQLDFPTDTQGPLQAKGLVIRDPVTARIVDISGGLFHSLALSANGEVAAWGENKNSQTETPEGLGKVSQIDAGDEFNLIVEESTLPKIESIIPGNTSLLSGEDIVLRVRATGGPDIAFQWLFNNAPIDGATDEALFRSNLTATGAGSYSVKVTSGGNDVSSSPIQIDVTTNQATITTQTVRAIRTYNGAYLFSPIETNPPGLTLAVRATGNLKLPSTAGTHLISLDIDQDGYEATPMDNVTLELDTLTGESLQLLETESGMTIRYLAPEGFSSTLQTSSDMRDWTNLANVPNGDGNLYDFPLMGPTDYFYRVVFETPATN